MADETKSISFSYNLVPPDTVDPAHVTLGSSPVPTTDTVSFHLVQSAQPTSLSPSASYYAAASSSVREAQTRLNELLTAWKDAIGDAEKQKEDRGKVAHGKGKAARIMLAAAAAESALSSTTEPNSDDDDDNLELDDAW